VPLGVLFLVVIFRLEEPEVVTEDGLNVPVAPLGNPLTLNPTVPVNPPEGVTVTVYVVLFPRLTVLELGEAEIEKSGVATTRVALTVWVLSDVLVPVMVSV
jgi:ABC-type enterobactin transport system permease subunit